MKLERSFSMLVIAIFTIYICLNSFVFAATVGNYVLTAPSGVSIELANSKTGNIYSLDQLPEIQVILKNAYTNELSGQITVTVKNAEETNAVIWTSAAETVSLDAGEVFVKGGIFPEIESFGLYKAAVSFSSNKGNYSDECNFSVSVKNNRTNPNIGITTNLQTVGTSTKDIEVAKNAGIGWLRDDMPWRSVEAKGANGVFKKPAKQHNYYIESLDSEINQTIILGYGHWDYDYNADGYIWYSSTTGNKLGGPYYYNLPYSETGIQAYGNYCREVASWYKEKGEKVVYQVWNEPDIPSFAGRLITDGNEYVNLLKEAYTEVKNVSPDSIVATAGFCDMDQINGLLLKVLDIPGVTNYMDAFCIHPYNRDGYYSDELWWSCMHWINSISQKLEEAKLRDGNQDKDIKLWVSEFGTSSKEVTEAEPWGYTERQQAANLVRSISAANSIENFEKFFIYNLIEMNIPDQVSTVSERHYGIVRKNYEAKPAYLAVSFLNKLLNGASYADESYGEIRYNSGIYSGYRFKKGNNVNGKNDEDIYVLWEHTGKSAQLKLSQGTSSGNAVTQTTNNTITIKVPAGSKALLYDMYGNPVNYAETIDLTDEPIYVVCSSTESFDMKLDGNKATVTGKAAAGQNVTITVKEDSGNGETVFFNQKESDVAGAYSFEIELSDINSQQYQITVFDGDTLKSVLTPKDVWFNDYVTPVSDRYYTLALRTFDGWDTVVQKERDAYDTSSNCSLVDTPDGGKALNIAKGANFYDGLPFSTSAAADLKNTNTNKFKYSYDISLHPDASLCVLWCATPGFDYNGCRIEIGRSNGNGYLYFGKNEDGYKTPSLWDNSTAGKREYSDWHRVETEVDFTVSPMTQKVKVTNLKTGNVIFDNVLPEIQITHRSNCQNYTDKAVESEKLIRQVIIRDNTSGTYDAGYVDNLRCEMKSNPVTATIGSLENYSKTEGYIDLSVKVDNADNNGLFKGNILVASFDKNKSLLKVDCKAFETDKRAETTISDVYNISPDAYSLGVYVWGDQNVPVTQKASVVLN